MVSKLVVLLVFNPLIIFSFALCGRRQIPILYQAIILVLNTCAISHIFQKMHTAMYVHELRVYTIYSYVHVSNVCQISKRFLVVELVYMYIILQVCSQKQ